MNCIIVSIFAQIPIDADCLFSFNDRIEWYWVQFFSFLMMMMLSLLWSLQDIDMWILANTFLFHTYYKSFPQ